MPVEVAQELQVEVKKAQLHGHMISCSYSLRLSMCFQQELIRGMTVCYLPNYKKS